MPPYNPNYPFNGGYSGNGYRNNNNRQTDYNGSYRQEYQPNQQPKKHTGCGKKDFYMRNGGKERVDAPCIFGWRYSRAEGGKSSFVAVPAKNPKTKNPRWLKFVVTVTPPGMAGKITTTGFWDIDKQRLRMPDLKGGMVANPNAPNGGYWGRAIKPSGR